MSESETLEEILAEEVAKEAAELGGAEEADVEVGPDVVDELLEEGGDDDGEGELTEGDEDAEADAEGDEDEDEQLEDEELDEDEEPEGVDDLAAVRAAKESVERELRLVRQDQELLKAQLQQLLQRDQEPKAPAPPARNPEFTEGLRLALIGGDGAEEAFKSLPLAVQKTALRRAEEFREDTVLQAENPAAWYDKVILPFVENHIRFHTRQFEQLREQSEAERLIDQYRDYVTQPGVSSRVAKIMEELPSSMGNAKRMKLAVELDRHRHGAVSDAKAADRRRSKDRDSKAKDNARRARGRGRRRGGVRPKIKEQSDVLSDLEQLSKLTDAELEALEKQL